MGAQRLEVDGAGRPILRKEGRPGPEADRLRREATALEAAAHPGVVQLLGVEEAGDGGVSLRLAVAGTRTLADLRADLPAAARTLAGLATTVADLHDLGLVHGRVAADHVVLDGAGRAVLCGFAEAGPRGHLDPAVDVLGLGSLLSSILSRAGAGPDGDWEPIPERRFGRNDRWLGFVRRALLTLADQATAEEPLRRPTARAFAASVLAALPAPATARSPADRVAGWLTSRRPSPDDGPAAPPAPLDAVALLQAAEPDDAPARAGRWRPPRIDGVGRVAAPIAGAVGLGLLVFGIGALLRPAGAPPSASPSTSASTSRPAAVDPTTGPIPTAPAPTAPATSAASACATTQPPAADPDGDGCSSTVLVGDAVVEVDGVRYGVGRPGDLLAVGDWDCDGAATVALVRRGSGEVFVFDGWATGADEATATSRGTVPGAEAIEPPAAAESCGRLVVVDGDGARTEVPA